jgi:hypothetical protein
VRVTKGRIEREEAMTTKAEIQERLEELRVELRVPEFPEDENA